MREELLILDGTTYLHIQQSDDGYDYTLYDKATRCVIDGGVLEAQAVSIAIARQSILNVLDLEPETMKRCPLEVLDRLCG